MAEAQSKQESARAGDEDAPVARTKETALIRGNKSMSLDRKFTQTLGRSMSSSGKCGRVKNHKYRMVTLQLPPAIKVTHCNSVCGPPSFPAQLGTELSLQR